MGFAKHFCSKRARSDRRAVREIAYHMASVRLPMDLEHFTSGNTIPLLRSTNRLRSQMARKLMPSRSLQIGEKWVGRDSLREHK